MSLKLLVHNALLLTLAPGQDEGFIGWMSVDASGLIDTVAAGEPPAGLSADTVIDAGGAFVAPGFVSAHSHLYTSGSRGLGSDCALYGWGLAANHYTRHADATDIYWCTLHGSLDFLNNGITTAYDFTDTRLPVVSVHRGMPTYSNELRPPAYAEEQFRAKLDAGIRFINSIKLDDAAGSDGEVLDRFAHMMAFAEPFTEGGQYLGMAVSGNVQRSPTKHSVELEVEVMRQFKVINQSHFLETAEVLEDQRPKFEWLRETGAMGPDFIFGHFIHPDEDMIAEAGRCGCGMVWQPTSNGRLASGIAPVRACMAAGVTVGVGLDDQSCTDVSDPFQNMRMGIYMQRAKYSDPAAMGVLEMLRLHTVGSAKVLGIEDRVGSLQPGLFADFLIVDPLSPDIGPVWNPVASYVLACGLRNLKSVYVGGELRAQDGRILSPLGREATRQVHQRLQRIAAQIEH
jgi:cytosine/adenosine deaminase-related metal-dependent hydrolase